VKEGSFREDLFHRISQIDIVVPPLRERKDDILLLSSAFMNELCIKEKKALTISDEVMKAFENYNWPGNVRQLKNIIERAVILATGDKITLKEIPEELLSFKRTMTTSNNPLKTFRELEMEALKDALQVCKGNKSKASRILGISRKAMYKRLRESQHKEYAI
jgi:two-component system response regulator HydG